MLVGKVIGGFGLAAALTVALATPARAAVLATLSPTAGQPGDVITLTTLEWVGAGPVYLVSTADFQAEIARFGGQVCGSPGQHYLGKLAQNGDTGSLPFRVPEIPKGDYYFELTVQAGCWRVAASRGGPLVLTVGDHSTARAPSPRGAVAAVQESRPAAVPGSFLVPALVLGAALAGVATTLTLLGRRARS